MNIGQRILQLRKQNNLTQEKLASMVGVSAGAVSKWENGNSTPDISLLVPLARALGTNLDHLLSFNPEITETEVNHIKQELTHLFLNDGYAIGEKKSVEYLHEYPNSIPLKFTVAGLLNMYLMMTEDRSEEFITARRHQSLDLLRQVVDSRDPKYTSLAWFCIASMQMNLGNLEETEAALQEITQPLINSRALYSELYLRQGKAKEALEYAEKMLLQDTVQTGFSLTTMAKASKMEKDYDRAFFYLNTLHKLESIFGTGLYSAAYHCCNLCIEVGKLEEAAHWLDIYVEGVISAGYDYSENPFFKDVELEVKPEEQKIVRQQLLQSILEEEQLKALDGLPLYAQAMEKLKASLR
ncbi:helix-turn-helix domain-containing protein [Paenibacillus puldeungensis]|uniref:Helix-turn-helix domain-containing protein n=1 Tax=Paenibacillus puldeungensis TaxID=696536 RepID=A0ABW3S0B6_9BACL